MQRIALDLAALVARNGNRQAGTGLRNLYLLQWSDGGAVIYSLSATAQQWVETSGRSKVDSSVEFLPSAANERVVGRARLGRLLLQNGGDPFKSFRVGIARFDWNAIPTLLLGNSTETPRNHPREHLTVVDEPAPQLLQLGVDEFVLRLGPVLDDDPEVFNVVR